MTDIANDCLNLRLAEQSILKSTLEEKNAKLEELEFQVRYLRNLLSGYRRKVPVNILRDVSEGDTG